MACTSPSSLAEETLEHSTQKSSFATAELGQTVHAVIDLLLTGDPVSGDKITLTVAPEGVEDMNPSSTVVSWSRSPDGPDIRGTFCRYGRFFAGRDTARQWQDEHPAIEILSVREATEAIRRIDALL